MTNPVDGDYQLILLAEQHIETLYDWSTTEKHLYSVHLPAEKTGISIGWKNARALLD